MSRRAKRKRSRKNQSVARRRADSVAETNQSVEVTSVTRTTSWSGPIPSPAMLREFDMVVPGLAERIVRMTELQSEHRIRMESTVIGGDSKRAYLGLACAFVLSLLLIAVGTYAVIWGNPWVGVATFSLDIAVLAGVFVYGTNTRRRERERKAADANPRRD